VFFLDFRNDLNQRLVPHVIQKLVNQCNNQGKYIGYKGGHLKHNLLIAAKAKYIINIEKLGTPKYNIIRKQIECQQLASTFDRKIVTRNPTPTNTTVRWKKFASSPLGLLIIILKSIYFV
jgi:hypothetical protein